MDFVYNDISAQPLYIRYLSKAGVDPVCYDNRQLSIYNNSADVYEFSVYIIEAFTRQWSECLIAEVIYGPLALTLIV